MMPTGSTHCCTDSIQPSRPNFAAAYAEQKANPTRPAVDEIEIMCPERCLRMIGRTARVTFIGPMRSVPNCRSEERRVGKGVDLGGPRNNKKKKNKIRR